MDDLILVKNLKKHFPTSSGMLHAVDGIDFAMKAGETLGVVGESGCGKSTLGRVILNLLPATDGEVFFEGQQILGLKGASLFKLRSEMQIIFQDPFSSLDPRMPVSELIAEPLRLHRKYTKELLAERIEYLMSTVGLAQRLYNAYPHELDGGRRQRIGIARALALNPKFIVCDEPVSALDVSIQAQILNLMQDLQEERKLTYIFITHDLSVVKHISTHILVMYLGKTMEKGLTSDIFRSAAHPYTKALLSAIPTPAIGPGKTLKRTILEGEVSSPINPRPGCRFAPRCPYATSICSACDPEFEEVGDSHFVACHNIKNI